MAQSELALERGPERFVKSERSRNRVRRHRASMLLYAGAFAFYLALGWYTTIHLHVVPGDAESRLTHAYEVFWNRPAKLAALGFVWPPLMSAVFLPFALLKPLATSLWALPVMSALFGAALALTLERALHGAGMGRAQRLVLVILFGLNPMVAAYASNGMSEILAQWLLLFAIVAFVRWYSDRLPRQLIVVGLFVMLGTLVRYELALWLLVIVPAIGFMVADRRQRRLEFEASAIAVLAPVFYALSVWTMLNWTILGSPFAWLHEETTQTFVLTRTAHGETFGLLHVIGVVAGENALLFPGTFVVAGALAVAAVVRRDVMAAALALILLLNVASTVAIAVLTRTPHIYELRFNIRTMPLTLVGIAWLYRQSASPRARTAIWAGAAVMLAATIPLTWHTMRTYRVQLDEHAFVAALATGRDQSHLIAGIDPRADRDMARYIRAHAHGEGAVLTDDSQTFGTILMTGRPDLFTDRIDHGDEKWLQVAQHPYGKVRYLLLSWIDSDLLTKLYPGLYGSDGRRGLRLAHATRTSRLYAVVGRVH